MEAVFAEVLGAGAAVFAEHGAPDVEVDEAVVFGTGGGDHLVGFVHGGGQFPAGDAGFDGDEH